MCWKLLINIIPENQQIFRMSKTLLHQIIAIIIGTLVSASIYAQEKGLILSQYYSPTDYQSGTQNWAIAQDARGVMYFGNAYGILEYDGVNWQLIQVDNHSSVRSLAFDSKNILYAGAYGEMGYLSPDEVGKLQYHSLKSLIDSTKLDFGEVWDIQIISDSVYFLTDRYIFRYYNNHIDAWVSANKNFYLSYVINGKYYALEREKGLLQVKNDSLVLIKRGEYFADKKIHNIIPVDDNLLICTRDKGLYLYGKQGKSFKIRSFEDISPKTKRLNQYFKENIFYHGISIADSLYALSTVAGNILIVNKQWDVVDVINNETIGIKSSVHYLFHQGNSLWLALDNGICQVEILSPYRFWNDDQGLSGTFTDIARLNDYLYITTTSGIYYTNSASTSDFELNRFTRVNGTFEQSWGFLYYQPPGSSAYDERINNRHISNLITTPKTKLLVATSRGLFELRKDKSRQVSDYKKIYLSYQYKKDPNYVFIGLDDGIAMLSYNDGNWKDHGYQFGIEGMIRNMGEDTLGNLWFNCNYKGLYRVSNPLDSTAQQIEFYDTTHNLPSVDAVGIEIFEDTLVFFSYNQLYTFNPEVNEFEEFKPSRRNTTQEESKKQPVDSLSFYRIYKNTLTFDYIIDAEDPSIWFGSTLGVCRYLYSELANYTVTSPTLVRKVIANDSIIFNGTNYTQQTNSDTLILNAQSNVDLNSLLEYKDNSVTFFYSSPNYEEEETNEYSFYLEGFDNKWSEWTKETKKEYTNLREGDYVFKVKSKNIYQIETTTAEFKFSVLPPWYRSFGAFIGYTIFGIISIVLIVKLYTYKLLKEKDKLEKIVIERTQEILMQKEEILVQAEHLKEANERISAKNQELEQQKWEITNQAIKLKKANIELLKLSKVASETDNAIAIFDKDGNIEWVNDGFTRLYGYSLEEFKKEKTSNILNASYHPNIKKAILSCINEKKSVVYEFKTTRRDGQDIWAQTTLTHVVDKDGNTLNLIAIDSDITEIKLAEKELSEQRDQLALSNATKNKFFRIIAHDLRNPISTLAGSTNLIFNDFDEYDKEQTKTFIGELNKLSQTTFNLLENLLDWSSTQMGDISFMPKSLDIKSLVDETIELIKRRINHKNISLKLDIQKQSVALADENMVKTILRNLLSNAVKFTPENGEIVIHTELKDDWIYCTVKDTGIGIEKSNLEKLFKIDQHYTRPGLENEKGSGLGLILCKEFVEKNGGEIHIESEPDKGTTIIFSLKQYIV